jgi:glycosyltransferase involved in cell wall biosynthesis
MMPSLTVLIATRNEERNLERCLASISGLDARIIVLDSESSDATVEIARRHGEVENLAYDHTRIIPWIFQWALDSLAIQSEWILILEADQALTPELRDELRALIARDDVKENGFFIRRRQIFRGTAIRFGGYGGKHLLKLFRRGRGRLDPEEQDTRVYIDGPAGKLRAPLEEWNKKEDEILFFLQKHLRYADAFAREELLRRRRGISWKLEPRLFGNQDERTLWWKTRYYRSPRFLRPFALFCYRYVLRLGFLDGWNGFLFHFLGAFWFRLVVDVRLKELETELPAPPAAEIL